ncbi:MAG TPA: poly-beta-1,6-N-acetyl-D-glucosamine biosynthesis protein PgaD, partial [Acinetobacter ursingii]|nr:poly-beta-1,6-N-acetyl-D-glucosamine biosynthesis protein PgaD [Acinetobacter ursingii]
MKNDQIHSHSHVDQNPLDIPQYIDRPEYVKNKWAG